ncbi:hypothetical protein [Embleya sp. NBC_00896]|uniref:hypothetical protein n=1 Tax=Embleya sp. NBC_00896 TaxID=2975961 RepID=UPI003867D0EE|nr:hypothetical protein OG928_32395 [Embleya sp. NBC_00896]
MPRALRAVAMTALMLALGAAAIACSSTDSASSSTGSALSAADDSLQSAPQLMARTTSFHVEAHAGGENGMDVKARFNGKDAAGTLDYVGGGHAEFVRQGGTLYVKADQGFWRRVGADPSMLPAADRHPWVRVPGDDAEPINMLVDIADSRRVLSLVKTSSPCRFGPDATPDTGPGAGRCLEWSAANAKQPFLRTYFAPTGKPYPTRVIAADPTMRVDATYHGFDEPVSVSAPTEPTIDFVAAKS